MFVIILLLAAILITLLGAWPIAGWILAIVVALGVVALIWGLLMFGVEALGESMEVQWFRARLDRAVKVRELKRRIEQRKKLGYDTQELEEELAQKKKTVGAKK